MSAGDVEIVFVLFLKFSESPIGSSTITTYIIAVMSTQIYRHIFLTSVSLVILAAILSVVVAADDAYRDDPVLEYYCKQAEEACESRDPLQRGVSFSYVARAYYKKLRGNGSVEKLDSAIHKYYYSFGTLDSQNTTIVTSKRVKELDLSYPDVFGGDYLYNFFPNDTGGETIAIGFDTDTVIDNRPVGLATIDREYYFFHNIFLYYPNRPDHRRYTRSMGFTEYQGYIFPDTMWVVGAAEAVFFTESYRIEVDIDSIQIYR